MTTYQGGKKRLGKRIYRVIKTVEDDLYDKKLKYFEPFVGMGGVINHFGKDEDRKLCASDVNIDIVMMWKRLQKGWKPPLTCTKEEYIRLKKTKVHSAKRGFIGAAASWGGIFFHAYRLGYAEKSNRNFLEEDWRSLSKIIPNMKKIDFLEPKSYHKFKPKKCLVYCDPPYKGNNLGNSKSLFQTFDHDKFWKDMEKWSENNLVIISETSAPKEFKKIWSATSTVHNGNKAKKYTDNLYVHETIYDDISDETLKEIKDI